MTRNSPARGGNFRPVSSQRAHFSARPAMSLVSASYRPRRAAKTTSVPSPSPSSKAGSASGGSCRSPSITTIDSPRARASPATIAAFWPTFLPRTMPPTRLSSSASCSITVRAPSGEASSTNSSSYARDASARSTRAASSARLAAFRKTGTTTLSAGGSSVTGSDVDNVQQRLVGGKATEIFHEQRLPAEWRALATSADVRSKQQVRLVPGGVIRRRRLVAQDIDGRAAEAAAAQHLEQRVLVERLRPAHVHDECAGRQGAELGRTDNASRLLGQRQRQDEDVCLGQS